MLRWLPAGPGFAVPARADAETYANLALKLAAQRYWSEAEQLNQEALALQPYHPTLHYNQGWLAARQGNWSAALNHFDRALALEPTHRSARLNRAWVYQQLGQAEAARTDLQWCQKHAEGDDSPLERARSQQMLGEHAAAITALTALIAAQPEQFDVYYWRSRSFLAQNQPAEAIADLGHVLEHYPDPALYAERARLYLKQSEPSAAVADFERSLVLKDLPEVRLELARLYLSLGQTERLQQHLQVLDPVQDTVLQVDYTLLQVETLLKQGDLQAAAKALAQALEQMPDQGGLWLLQARLQRQKRQYAAAEQAIQKAAERGYRASRIAAERALLAAQRGQREAARAYLREALKTEPALKKDFQGERLLKSLLD
ncbi:MAG: tetratricopeptide repeat protein [Candidatus Sericytochromatia bacterium]|nr:tetratricopeptide repeat protein [Candidatus Sericytochromatia bacterium]